MGIKGLTKLIADRAPEAIREGEIGNYFSAEPPPYLSLLCQSISVVSFRYIHALTHSEVGAVLVMVMALVQRAVRRRYVFRVGVCLSEIVECGHASVSICGPHCGCGF
jgi:hypothetical protein